MRKHSPATILLLVIIFLGACSPTNAPSPEQKLNVAATTTIVGDVVAKIGGDAISLSVLLPVGADPHSFDPSPQDIAKIAEADVVFVNGGGLEAFLDKLIESAGAQEKVIEVSDGVEMLQFAEPQPENEHTDEHENEDDEHAHGSADPHTWTDPNNVIVWAHNIEQALIRLDPANKEIYAQNTDAYIAELKALDAWVRKQVAEIPENNRKIVTDHAIFNYFASTYGFTQIGALIPGFSTLAEPTAKELADMEDTIQAMEVRAVFVGNTVNPALAERVAEDSGIKLVFLYTGSLSEPAGEAATYLDYIRYNVNAFVTALK